MEKEEGEGKEEACVCGGGGHECVHVYCQGNTITHADIQCEGHRRKGWHPKEGSWYTLYTGGPKEKC